jgi:hypothetical protein
MADAPDPEIARLAAESKKMEAAILAIHWRWARLEDAMAGLLNVALAERPFDGRLDISGDGFLIYFTPTNTETRFRIVDTIIRFRFARLPLPLGYWATLWERLGGVQGTRNRVIHGNVVTIAVPIKGGPRAKNHVRLTASLWDRARFDRVKRGQLNGMSAHDVQASANAMGRLIEDLNALRPLVSGAQTDDIATLHEKWIALEAHRKG